MNKHTYFITGLLLSMIVCQNSFAQDYTMDQFRRINLAAVDLIERYETNAKFRKPEHSRGFLELFSDTSNSIHNDIIPDNRLDTTIHVGEYVRRIKQYYNGVGVSMEILSLEMPQRNPKKDGFLIVVHTTKMISGYTKNNRAYSDTIPEDFYIGFQKIDQKFGDFAIETIECKKSLGRYFYLKVSDDHNRPLNPYRAYINGKFHLAPTDTLGKPIWIKDLNAPLYILPDTVNSDDESMFPRFKNFWEAKARLGGKKGFSTKDDFNFMVKSPDLVFGIRFNPLSISGTHFTFSKPSSTNSKFESLALKGNFNRHFSAFLGKIIARKSGYTLHMNTGLGFSSMGFNARLDKYSNQFETTDPDGARYFRRVQLGSVSEDFTLSFVSIPVFLNVEKRVSQKHKLDVFADAGLMLCITTGQSYESKASGVRYAGYYPQLYNIEMDDNRIYDFGSFSEAIGKKETHLKTMGLDAFVRAGLSLRLKPRMYAFMNLAYQQSLSNLKKTDLSVPGLSPNTSSLYSVTDLMQNLKRSFTQLETGIKFKI
jgi:hypothetical protein